MSNCIHTPEEIAAAAVDGLDICGYPGKWKNAKDSVFAQHIEQTPEEYWSAVRLHFLELGGGYLSDRKQRGADPAGKPSYVKARMMIGFPTVYSCSPIKPRRA